MLLLGRAIVVRRGAQLAAQLWKPPPFEENFPAGDQLVAIGQVGLRAGDHVSHWLVRVHSIEFEQRLGIERSAQARQDAWRPEVGERAKLEFEAKHPA